MNFIGAATTVGGKPKKFKKLFDNQIDIDLENDAIALAMSSDKVAELPVRANFTGGLIFSLGKFIVEARDARYKATKEKKASLDLYILDLAATKDGKNNAAVEKTISYHRNRIIALEQDIANYEED